MKAATTLAIIPLLLSAGFSLADPLPKQRGGTDCAEWATMTQILVLRWQGENMPRPDGKQADNNDVKAQLKAQMKGHPELDYALEWVDYAYKHREGNPVHVWQKAKMLCEGTI